MATTPRSRFTLFAAGSILMCAVSGCLAPSGSAPVGWREQLETQLPVLGHRNWIVVADSAYPAQSAPGIQTIYTGETQIRTVSEVLAAIDRAAHVQPIVYLDAELTDVPEADAPGVTDFLMELDILLGDRTVRRLPHMEIIEKLDESAKLFNVLILKTDLTIPYTSVFINLDCGYWGEEKEKRMRDAVGSR